MGGVLPDIASKIIQKIGVVIEESLQKANIELKEAKKVFVTNGPGLINCLMIGVTAARTISLINQIPVYPINHVEGHIASCFIEHKMRSLLYALWFPEDIPVCSCFID